MARKPAANLLEMSNPIVDEEKMTTDGFKALMQRLSVYGTPNFRRPQRGVSGTDLRVG
jgi:hypothetical protein